MPIPFIATQNKERNVSTSRFIMFAHQKWPEPQLNQCTSSFQHGAFIHHSAGVAFGTHYIVSQPAFRHDTRGFSIYLGKDKVTTNFVIEPSPRKSTQPSPSSFISVSKNVIFHLQRRKLQPALNWRENELIQCLAKR